MTTVRLTITVLLLFLIVFTVARVGSNTEAQDFQLRDIQGKAFRLSDFRGKIVLLEFFASWCKPCKPQLMELKDVKAAYPPEQIILVSISYDPSTDTDEVLSRLAEETGTTWILARDTIGISGKYEVTIAPTIFVIDRSGITRYKHPGLTKSEVLTPEIDYLLSESPQHTPSGGVTSGSFTMSLLLIGVVVILVGSVFTIRKRRSSRKSERSRG